MGFKIIMMENKDVTAWGGVSAMLGIILNQAPSELGRQFLVIVIFPMLGWLGVYLLKELVTYLRELVTSWWKNRKTKTNNQ